MKRVKIKYLENEVYVYSDQENPDVIQRTWNAGNFYECSRNSLLPYLYATFKHKIEGGLVIDGGANLGNHSLFFVKVLGAKSVISFEPNPELFEILQKNIKTNKVSKKITAVNYALTFDKITGEMEKGCFIAKGGKINGITIDESVSLLNPPVTYIKLDIEGGELNALKGAEETLRKDKPLLSVECQTEAEFNRVNDYLSGFGYEVFTNKYGKPQPLNATPTYIFQ